MYKSKKRNKNWGLFIVLAFLVGVMALGGFLVYGEKIVGGENNSEIDGIRNAKSLVEDENLRIGHTVTFRSEVIRKEPILSQLILSNGVVCVYSDWASIRIGDIIIFSGEVMGFDMLGINTINSEAKQENIEVLIGNCKIKE